MKKNHLLLLLILAFSTSLFAQKDKERIELKHGSHRIGKRTDAAMDHWRNYGLGQFIHWGVYAIPGGYWEGRKTNRAAEWIRDWYEKGEDGKNRSPLFNGKPFTEIYDDFYKEFNPKDFDAKAWAKMAKQMGAKYMIFTTKHHDGFCMWPSKYTDYTIANTPYKKDIMKEIIDAYNAEGIDVVLYFSIIDWHHPDYQGATPKTDEDKTRYENFKKFTRNQLIELLTDYPTVKGLWFDGTWDAAWVKETAWADNLGNELRNIIPGLVIGSRFRADEFGKRHIDSNGEIIDDYYQYWERKLPTKYETVQSYDWEAVMTILPNNWGYIKDWSNMYQKTGEDLIEMMVRTVAFDGNFVLNFGPDGNGDFRPEEKVLAREIGDWMKVNGEAIHNTRNAGLEKQGWGYYTKNGNNMYLTIFNRPVNNKVRMAIPLKSDLKPLTATIIANKQALDLQRIPLGLDRDINHPENNYAFYDIVIPADFASNQPFVIKVTTEGSEVKADETIQKAYQ